MDAVQREESIQVNLRDQEAFASCLQPAISSFFDSVEGNAEFDLWMQEQKKIDTGKRV